MYCKLKFWGLIVCGKVVVMIRMSGLTRAKHWHVLGVQMQGCRHVGIVLFGGTPRCVPTFNMTRSLVVEWKRSSLWIC